LLQPVAELVTEIVKSVYSAIRSSLANAPSDVVQAAGFENRVTFGVDPTDIARTCEREPNRGILEEELTDTLKHAPTEVTQSSKGERRAIWMARAMLTVREHPDWSDSAIATKVDVHKSTLSRCAEYRMAAAMARGTRTDWPQGHISVDSDSGLSDVEAAAPPSDGAHDQLDRGQPLPGSQYFREYCSACDEPIKVTQDKVNAKPLCEACQN
jgi:hypothetical protein